ncbi:Hypothetical predicted protein [Mytilus galloprovincialis]|uniref:Uncharacterized protein n=1 Tax=Mytilus galloprovincialis TaxID=29158 RepID=A0A8B6CK08_MYTGA|nr:Hypothetical predicted protein [Mytilus galloprovincialis]
MGNGCCCCSDPVDEEDAFMKQRNFVIDSKIFTLGKYGKQETTEAQNDPEKNRKFESFKDSKPDKNSNVKSIKKHSFRKSKMGSSRRVKPNREFIRTCSMEEFCESVSKY